MKLQLKLFAAAATVLLAAMPLSAFADEESAGTETFTSPDGMYNYVLTEDGGVRITDLIDNRSYEGAIVIPGEIDGKAVTALGNGAFVGAVNVTSVTIPASVTEIGECVFQNCPAIEEFIVEEGNTYLTVHEDGSLLGDEAAFYLAYPCGKADTAYTLPDGIEEIAPAAFSYALNLEEVTVTEGVLWIDPWAFSYSAITTITLPDSLETIDDYAFAYCTHLHDVDLGEGLETILNASFAECRALTEITLPDTLTYIGQQAFIGTSLPSVTIPSSVTTISYYAFGYDTSYNQIESFVVYGEENSMAQSYCTAVDEDNDYENSFTFISISDDTETQAVTDAAGNVLPQETAPVVETTPIPPEEELTKDDILRYVLIGSGAVAAVLVIVLAFLMVRLRKLRNPEPSGQEASAPEPEQDDEA